MDNGYVILSIVALIFLSMYGFAYASVTIEKIKQRKAKKVEKIEEELRLQEKAEKERLREEKLKEISKRSEEIKNELKRLEKVKIKGMDMDSQKTG